MRIVDRILAVSDIHGENKKFLQLLDEAAYEPDKDLLVVCGDLIDRGTENLETIRTCQRLQKQGAVILKGNHEQFADEAITEMLAGRTPLNSAALRHWVDRNGGNNTYDEFELLDVEKLIDIRAFIRGLSHYYCCGDFIFVHAGVNSRKPIEQNTEDEIFYAGQEFHCCPAYRDKVVVFGHTPTWLLHKYPKKGKVERKNAKIWFDTVIKDKIGIDCGSVFGGRLAALELPNGRGFYV